MIIIFEFPNGKNVNRKMDGSHMYVNEENCHTASATSPRIPGGGAHKHFFDRDARPRQISNTQKSRMTLNSNPKKNRMPQNSNPKKIE